MFLLDICTKYNSLQFNNELMSMSVLNKNNNFIEGGI